MKKLNNKGFIAISVIYSFFILFISILLLIIYSYVSDRKLTSRIKEDIINKIQMKKNTGYLCKRARTLHTESCPYDSSRHYISEIEEYYSQTYCEYEHDFEDSEGYCFISATREIGDTYYNSCDTNSNGVIRYGLLETDDPLDSDADNFYNNNLRVGDAFDCDVNGDKILDPITERFYFMNYYYDFQNNDYDHSTAVLIYYSNVSAGQPNQSATFAYDNTNSTNGPRNAAQQLPTTQQWSNVSLKNTQKKLGYDSVTFNYDGHAARLPNLYEISNTSYMNYSLYENTKYVNSNLSVSYWLENPQYGGEISIFPTIIENKDTTNPTDTSIGVRPVIDVPLDRIKLD